jgi:peptidyl-prolyl cis-trans isomerase SurA
MKRLFLRAALVILALGLGMTAQAQDGSATLDKIVATVDDEVVLLSAVIQDVELFLMQMGTRVDSLQYRQLMEEALNNMISEKLLLAKARRELVEIGSDELRMALDRHIDGLVQQAGGQARFQRQLDAEGMDLRELRRRLSDPMRDQMMVQRVVENLTWELEITEPEALSFFEANKLDAEIIPLRPRAVKLSHLLVVPRAAADKEALARKDWQAALDRLAAGEGFGEVAKALSKGPAAAVGGDLGWINLQDIARPALQETLVNLEPGQLAEEVLTEDGLHILLMNNREGARVHFSQIVFPLEITEDDRTLARDKAREALNFLKDGGDWAEAVTRYTDDKYTRDQAGELPIMPLDQLDDRYRDIVELLEPKEFSTVFKGIRGYQIVLLNEREAPRPFEFEEIKDQLRTELLAQKRNEVIGEFLLQLEGEIFVQRMGIPEPEATGPVGGLVP